MKIKKESLDESVIYLDTVYEEELDEAGVNEFIEDLLAALDKQNDIIQQLEDQIDELEDDIKYNYRRVGGIEY